MEALLLFFFPLIFYIAIRIAILRDKDLVQEELRKFSEGLKMIEFGFHEEAIVYCDKIIKDHQKSTVAYAMRGKAHLMLKNYYQAIYNFDKAASFSNDLPEVFLNKAIALYHIEDYEQAMKELNRAVWFYREKNPVAYRWRGFVYEKLQKQELAMKDFKTAWALGDKPALSILEKNRHL